MRTTLPLDPSVVCATCFCLGLRRAARAVSRRFDEGLRPLDLNNGQFSMLTVVAGRQPISIQDLAEHLAMDRTTVTAALKPLQRRGLIAVDVCESDSRSREARLTAPGKALLAKAMPLWRRVQEEVGAAMPVSEASQLHRHLAALR